MFIKRATFNRLTATIKDLGNQHVMDQRSLKRKKQALQKRYYTTCEQYRQKCRRILLNQSNHYQLYVIYAGLNSGRIPDGKYSALGTFFLLNDPCNIRPVNLISLNEIHKIVFTKKQLLALYKTVSKGHSTMGQTILKMTKKNTFSLKHAIRIGLINIANLNTFIRHDK